MTLITLLFISITAKSEEGYARQEGEIFYIGNNRIERSFKWNSGNLITIAILDKESGKKWENSSNQADFFVPGQKSSDMKPGSWQAERVSNPVTNPYLQVTVSCTIEGLHIRRVFRVYDDTPAIAVDTYLRGSAKNSWIIQDWDLGKWSYLPQRKILSQTEELLILDQLNLGGDHWKLDYVDFTDNTDSHNTLVKNHSETAYRENIYRGNIMFLGNIEDELGLFYLKESPVASSQLSYPGADFIVGQGKVKVIGAGVVASDIVGDEWTKTYSVLFGVSAADRYSQLKALHSYHKAKRKQDPANEEMILMNTWGDRGTGRSLTEQFCFEQIDACAALGVSHFQLDWGWQESRDYVDDQGREIKRWTPKQSLYPNGFERVVEYGKRAGVEVCLYFVPNLKHDNEAWEDDADILIGLNKKYGVRIFKIDGQQMQSKVGEERARRMYEKVMRETNYEVIFNYDITAGQRGGFFYLNEYGNLFVENRYTLYKNYFPYKTLRNLWMLSQYIPAEKIQVEFLNRFRNEDKYGEDIFAPKNYSMDYLFAVSMAGQPLAFMDVGNLPDDAFENRDLIKQYREIQHQFHRGIILPIGDEPSGRSWTGFQSIGEDEGFLLFFREYNSNSLEEVRTWLEPGKTVELTPVLGTGKRAKQKVKRAGGISVELPLKNSFVLYRYVVK